MRRKIVMALALLAGVTNAVADIVVSDVEVFSGWPWKEVAIGYTIAHANGSLLVVEARDLETGVSYLASNTEMSNISGADLTVGQHVLKWNMAADGIRIKSNKVKFSVRVWEQAPKYCVINLAGGSSAQDYQVEYIDEIPPEGWTGEYKTTKLVLKLIGPGQFKMRDEYNVVLTKPFYMGVFEVTQTQFASVMGWNPSFYGGGMRPVEEVLYDDIRGSSAGTGWPANNAVDADSFLGKLRMKTGLDFDLPTEAQWEYACRAGTTARGWGGVWNYGNSGYYPETHDVGTRLPNDWGFYDMLGNAWELCLDWCGDIKSATDPRGADSGTHRVGCGGCSSSYDNYCTPSSRRACHPSDLRVNSSGVGFRLAKTLLD